MKEGIKLRLKAGIHEHEVMLSSITCKYMNKINTMDPCHCPIYWAMKENYEFNKDNLKHLREFTHFLNEYEDKPICKYGDQCKKFLRQENGGDEIKDECRMKLYRHPPRTRGVKLADNIASLVINKSEKENHSLYKPKMVMDIY